MNFDQHMPSSPRTLPRANTLLQQPPSQAPSQPPAEGGVDPAALIAARTAAVARNRQREARAAMVRDVLRIIFVGVIIGGVAWVGLRMHRHRMEEERLRIEGEQRMQEKRAEERRERDERQEEIQKDKKQIQRKKEEAIREERRKKDEENKAKADAARERKKNAERYEGAAKCFREAATLVLFSPGLSESDPEKVKVETVFYCFVPGGRKGTIFYELQALPGKNIHVTRLDKEGGAEDVPYGEFRHLLANTPFVLAKSSGSCCYCRPQSMKWEMPARVPGANESLNPSSKDFGDLYASIDKHCGKGGADFSYEVFFRDVGGNMTRILGVPFRGQFTRADVVRGLQQAGSGRGRDVAADIQKRLNEGSLVIRRKGSSW